MRPVDQKLYKYLSSFDRLGNFIRPFKGSDKLADEKGGWFIGQGFQPFNDGRSSAIPHISQEVVRYPYLPVQSLQNLYQKSSDLKPWSSTHVRRKGFEAAYGQKKILISRGVGTSQMRLKASYCDDPITFAYVASLVFPEQKFKSEVLAAYLNSKLALWFAFHGTASFGSGRRKFSNLSF